MLHPSYTELMKLINDDSSETEIKSRYSIVIAASKRARQLIDGDEQMVDSDIPKPLTIAVKEMENGKYQLKHE